MEAAGAASKVQEVAAGMARFSELQSLSAEDSAFIQSKYGDRIAQATKNFTEGLASAESSPIGGAIAGALGNFPTIGE